MRSGVEKVGQLEAYLGGDIPQLTSGRTWTEEREVMTCQIQVGGVWSGILHNIMVFG